LDVIEWTGTHSRPCSKDVCHLRNVEGDVDHMETLKKLQDLAARIPSMQEQLTTEEATKNALIMPFIQALGYNPFNPTEVVPEFTADIGIKKGEKVDYAILRDGDPIILIECKCFGADLSKHDSQLHRYFHTTRARIAILTDGVRYLIYSDLDEKNKMDERPFIEMNLLDLDERVVAELEKLRKPTFDIDAVLSSASNLKYRLEIKEILTQEMDQPSDDFARIFVDRVHGGRATQNVLARFRGLLKQSLSEYITGVVERRLKAALSKNQEEAGDTAATVDDESTNVGETPKSVETTVEEVEGFYAVKAILHDMVSPGRIFARDAKSYFAIILDDNNRKPICRLRFDGSNKYIGVFDENKTETRLPVAAPEDIFEYADRVRESLKHVL